MICPICNLPIENNQLRGYYKGPVFIVKGFKCCGVVQAPEAGHLIEFQYNIKTNEYEDVKVLIHAPLLKYDYIRLLRSSSLMELIK